MADCPPCPPCKKGAPGWLLTFGDLMSLLLTFFILLVSMSTIDKPKFKAASGSLKDAFGVQQLEIVNSLPTGEDLIAIEFQQDLIMVKLKEKLEVLLVPSINRGEVELVETNAGFLIHLDRSSIFQNDSNVLLPSAKSLLLQLAVLMRDIPNLVRVEGHTSNQPPLASYASNWEQSAAEAAAIVQFLATEGEVNPGKLQVRGMGQVAPRDSNDTVDGRKRNHRLEVMISREAFPGRP
ncbi:MAG: OmpA/MotB domain protein [Magnetococcales bacterium]|nr:OmpA/MotB domain protein [Magnetococcales bacterium]HIJ83450.1 flagellar motor protein MotB [Magnetococcales bacterium]